MQAKRLHWGSHSRKRRWTCRDQFQLRRHGYPQEQLLWYCTSMSNVHRLCRGMWTSKGWLLLWLRASRTCDRGRKKRMSWIYQSGTPGRTDFKLWEIVFLFWGLAHGMCGYSLREYFYFLATITSNIRFNCIQSLLQTGGVYSLSKSNENQTKVAQPRTILRLILIWETLFTLRCFWMWFTVLLS